MTHIEIREKFLKFFEERGHKIVPSSSLLSTDPSVLFTTAGMQQFKSYYTDEADPMKDFGMLNTVSIQKCIRTSDIDEVGDDTHLTFFEMLGNFSFGGYFKKEAMQYGYDFITKILGLTIDYVSVFKGDKQTQADLESLEIWRSLGLPDDKIKFGERKDNFWGPTGNKGPCGPTTEIYVNGVEIWNIVFNEYFSDEENGKRYFVPLEKKGIDTGMGLERLAVVVQKKQNVFETDLLTPIFEEIRGKNLYDYQKNARSERIIADHFRAAIFLIADGVKPSNTDQGYILRRLIRRGIRHAKLLGLPTDFHERIFDAVSHHIYKDTYPEIEAKRDNILNTIWAEWGKFNHTLEGGLKIFERMISGDQKHISGKDAFELYASYGFPIELIEELAQEKGISVDQKGFNEELIKHKEISRAGSEKKFGGHGLLLDTGELKAGNEEELKKATQLHTATHLLHASLRKILGSDVKQAGSDITAERLRFDFTFPRKMTAEEIKEVEDLVNNAINNDYQVTKKEMAYEDAIKSGALAFFKLKYPPKVNVYTVGPEDQPFSRELCGGPHVNHTGEIGKFKITKEEAVSAGTRRIRATVL